MSTNYPSGPFVKSVLALYLADPSLNTVVFFTFLALLLISRFCNIATKVTKIHHVTALVS